MTTAFVRVFCFLFLAAGVVGESLPAPRAVAGVRQPADAAGSHGSVVLKPGDEFQVDVGALRDELHQLPIEERPEQIADWAMWGTALHAGLSAESIRGSLFDKPPVRLPALADTMNFDHGSGRRLVIGDNDVWLFRNERDPHPDATLGRLADLVRMEIGDLPAQVTIFGFRSDLTDGVVRVRCIERLRAKDLFASRFGWVEDTVRTRADLGRWLGRVDDVTHVRSLADGVVLGGRRFDADRTAGLTVEDVAVLYRAHKELATKNEALDEALNEPIKRFNAIVSALNGARRFGNDGITDKVAALRRLLGDDGDDYRLTPVADFGDAFGDLTGTKRRLGLGRPRPLEQAGFGMSEHAVDELRSKVEAAMKPDSPWMQRFFTEHEHVPPDPGFSLDPIWNLPGLASDVALLLDDPRKVLREAAHVVRDALRFSDSGQTALHQRALVLAFGVRKDNWNVPPPIQRRLSAVAAELRSGVRDRLHTKDADKAVVPFLQLVADAQKQPKALGMVAAYLNFLEARNKRQCARYDGPLQGTRVGMNLFYTDLLAKIWASVDFHKSAPTDEVLGFLSSPRIGDTVEATYWDEVWAKPNTRLWFGPRPEAYALSAGEDALAFTHIATRVYSAGSNPLSPGVEEQPAEFSRRVFAWWDRHYQQVADYEPQYHVQNQIMKWSVITGWLAKNGKLGSLSDPPPSALPVYRFPEWYAQEANLRFRTDVHFAPPFDPKGTTECLAILSSYLFDGAGQVGSIQGGVSLGSMRSIEKGTKISTEIPAALRRGGLLRDSSAGSLRSWKGAQIEMPTIRSTAAEAAWTIKPATGALMRAKGTDFKVGHLDSSVSIAEHGGRVRFGADGDAIGALTVERTDSGVRLSWQKGDVDLAQMRATEFASAVRQDVRNGGIPVDPRRVHTGWPSAEKPAYIVEGDTGEVVALAGSGGGGNRNGKVLRLATGDPGADGALLRVAARHPDSSSVTPVYGKLVDAKGAVAEVEHAKWQRLTVLDKTIEDPAPRTSRLFSNREPEAGARSVAIELADGGTINAKVGNGSLYLERPTTGGAANRFNDLVERYQLDGERLQQLLAIPEGQPMPKLSARSAGTQAADKAATGNAREALRLLAETEGSLDKVLGDFEAQAVRAGWSRGAGARGRGTGGFLPSSKPGASPDLTLLRALDDIDARDIHRAVKRIADVGATGKLRGTNLEDIAAKLSSFGPDGREMGNYLLATGQKIEGLAPDVAATVRIEASGHAVHTVAVLSAKAISPVPVADRASLIASAGTGRTVVYTDRSPHLVSYDWDVMPAKSLHKAVKDPDVVWELVDAPGLGKFRPTVLEDHGQGLIRRDLEVGSAAPGSASGSTPTQILRLRVRTPAANSSQNTDAGDAAGDAR